MSKIQRENKLAVVSSRGWEEIISKNIVSSSLTTAAQDFSTVATGRFLVKQVIFETDATGLAGATDFGLCTNNAIGLTGVSGGFAQTAVSGLGANKTKALLAGSDDSTNDNFMATTGVSPTLEAGKKLQFFGTVSAGTGAGVVRVTVILQRMDVGATISAV